MSGTSKQDLHGARTAADLVSRYNLKKSFAEVMGIATDAKNTAEAAQSSIDGLSQEQIFNLLTNNGAVKGIYRDANGEIYVNASYVKSGKISSDLIDGSTLTITSGATIAGWDIDNNSIFKKQDGGTWGSGTFMCTGSNSSYSIGGSGLISGWAFGAGGKFGVTSGGDAYCSALRATNGCTLGAWRISQNSITSATSDDEDGIKNSVWLEPTRVVYIYNQDSGDGIYATWENIIKATNAYIASL